MRIPMLEKLPLVLPQDPSAAWEGSNIRSWCLREKAKRPRTKRFALHHTAYTELRPIPPDFPDGIGGDSAIS